MKYIVAVASTSVFVLIFLYLAFFFSWIPAIPEVYPAGLAGQHMDAHVITASAFQENANLLVTLSLALTALFGFGIGKNFDSNSTELYLSVFTSVIFGICLTFVSVYAYGVYRAIAIQSDNNLFFAGTIESILTVETRWTFACAVLAIIAVGWRCARVP
jgi:uncharacterized membrane protein AbrB (regulator of aidB expression)